MKKYILPYLLLTIFAGTSFADAPSISINQEIEAVKAANRSGWWVNPAGYHAGLMKLYQDPRLNDGHRKAVMQHLCLNSASLTNEWSEIRVLLDKKPAGKETDREFTDLIQLLTNDNVSDKVFLRGWELYQAYGDRIEIARKPYIMKNLCFNVLMKFGEPALFEKIYHDIEALKLPGTPSPAEVQRFDKQKQDFMNKAILAYYNYDAVEADKFFPEHKITVPAELTLEILRCKLNRAKARGNAAEYAKLRKAIENLPDTPSRTEVLIYAAKQINDTKYVESLIDKKELPAKQRLAQLIWLRNAITPPAYIYDTYYMPGSYEKQKEFIRRIEAFAAAEKVDPGHGFYAGAATEAFQFGDYAFADEMIEKATADPQTREVYLNMLAEFQLRKGNKAEAVKLYEEYLQAKRFNPSQKLHAAAMKYFINGGTVTGFADAFKEEKLSPEQRLDIIRECSCAFFRVKDFASARRISADVDTVMLRAPSTDKVYDVLYEANAPKSAGAWAASKWYNDWNAMETRFEPYYGYHQDSSQDKQFLLKEKPEVKLNDAYRAGLHVLCDDSGVHFYLRSNDPDVAEVAAEKRSFGNLEWMFRPGEQRAYHSWFFSKLPNSKDPYEVNWSTPTRIYTMTEDFVTRDAVLTPDGVVAHCFVPWQPFWHSLPSKDNVWTIGVQVRARDSRTLSGMVHEQARALKLNFNFTPEQKLHLDRLIAVRAYNLYTVLRNDAGGMIMTWNDPVLGDQEFYQNALLPFLDKLDAAGKKLLAPVPDAELPALMSEFLPLWAGIRYEVEEIRTNYLKNRLLSEE